MDRAIGLYLVPETNPGWRAFFRQKTLKDFEGWGKSEPLYHAMDRIKYYYEEERDVSCGTVQPSFPVYPLRFPLTTAFSNHPRFYPFPSLPVSPRSKKLRPACETEVSKVWPLPNGPAINYTARNAFFISPRYYRSRWLY